MMLSQSGLTDFPKRDFVYAPPPGLPILHINDDYIIIDKPSGLLSVPGKSELDCAEQRLRRIHPEALTVHRLDMATSGLMIFARNPKAQRHLGLQFEKRQTEKTYIARIAGIPKQAEGMIDWPLIADWPNRPRQKVCYEHGKSALTHWVVQESKDDVTRVALHPKTGRSHQLRVHMAELGHPILGDRIYAPDDVFYAADRLQLHALMLRFRQPTGGDWVIYESPCPF